MNCPNCGPLPDDSFGKNIGRKSGYDKYCKKCGNDYQKHYRSTDKGREVTQAARKRWATSNPERANANYLVREARNRARRRNLPIEVDRKWIEDQFIQNPHCVCCNRSLNIGIDKKGKMGDDSPSLDQLVPGEGYTYMNVRIICWRCNRIKQDATPDELEMIATWIRTELTRREFK